MQFQKTLRKAELSELLVGGFQEVGNGAEWFQGCIEGCQRQQINQPTSIFWSGIEDVGR